LIRGTAWLAMLAWAAGEVVSASRLRREVRWLWATGALAMAAHLVAAMHLRHEWSHALAVAETARQTLARFGLNWGGGIWFNYALTILWLADAVWAWRDLEAWGRPSPWRACRRAFFLFMWLNGAVVFPAGPVRWCGTVVCVIVLLAWWRQSGLAHSEDTHPPAT
jgi:hypothetical protein